MEKAVQKKHLISDKNIAVYIICIREIQSFKYQHFNKMYGVGVANLRTNSEKIDIITYGDKFYIHRQIEKRNNIVFMRIKKRLLQH